MNNISLSKGMRIISRRELKSFFLSPIAYFVIGVFVLVASLFFFLQYAFKDSRAELTALFRLFPLMLAFAIPAITMRVFAEERKSGTFETLMTLPLRVDSIVLGKLIAVFLFSAVMILPTLFFPLTLSALGRFDFWPLFGGYLGTLMIAFSFSAIGIFASSLTENQIVAFIISLLINLFLALLHYFLNIFSGKVVEFFQYLTINYHISSISQGLFDLRNIIYFA